MQQMGQRTKMVTRSPDPRIDAPEEVMNESAELKTSADNDRSVLQSWHEWEVDSGERRIILCVETALELRPGYPGFEPMLLETLMRDATDLMRTSASRIDGLRIVPARWTL